jgi:hypothetical protein
LVWLGSALRIISLCCGIVDRSRGGFLSVESGLCRCVVWWSYNWRPCYSALCLIWPLVLLFPFDVSVLFAFALLALCFECGVDWYAFFLYYY